MNKKLFLFVFLFELFLLIPPSNAEDNKLPKKLGVNTKQSKMFFTWTPSMGSFMHQEMLKILSLLSYEGEDVSTIVDYENGYNRKEAGIVDFYKQIIKENSFSILAFYTHGSGGIGLTAEYYPYTDEGRKERDQRYLELMKKYAVDDYNLLINKYTEKGYETLIDLIPKYENLSDWLDEEITKYTDFILPSELMNIFTVFKVITEDISNLKDYLVNNAKEFNWENDYFAKSYHPDMHAYTIIIKWKFIEKYFRQSDSLVILASCSLFSRPELKNSFASPSSGGGAAVVIGAPESLVGEQIRKINMIISCLSGRYWTYFDYKDEEVPKPRVNYTLSEINQMKNNDDIGLWSYEMYSKKGLDYLIYRQPRITYLSVSSDDGTKYYNYLFPDSFNTESEYPGDELLSKARMQSIPQIGKIKVVMKFSELVKIDNKASELSKKGYSFKLYKGEIADLINFAKSQTAQSNLSSNTDIEKCLIDAEEVKTGKFLQETSMTFDLSKLRDCKNDGLGKVYIIAKVPDSYEYDEMIYLDTNGTGRDCKRGKCLHGKGCKFSEDKEFFQNGLDTNHWFWVAPGVEVKRAQVYKLHLPMVFEGEEPPSAANLQPLRSDGAIPLDWKKVGYLYSRCVTLPPWEKVSCTMDATMQAMKKLLPTYYLGPEILTAAAPAAPEPIVLEHYDGDNHSLEAGLQPVYTALVQTIDENRNDGLVPRIEPLATSGALRDEVKLWLDVNPIRAAEEKGYNTISASKTSLDISNLYDIYLFKDAPGQALIALPLKRLYESAEVGSLSDGAHTLCIETSLKNDEDATEKGYESLVTLKYIKDFEVGENAGNLGNSTASVVRDAGSGFSNRLLNYWIGNWPTSKKFINDMALNKIELPAPKRDEDVVHSPEKPEDIFTPTPPTDVKPKPPTTCQQIHSMSCRREEVNACHYRKTCDSIDFAVCYLPFPHVTNPTVNTTWNVFKINDVSCEGNEDYGSMGKFGVIFREGEPVQGQKPEGETAENPVIIPPEGPIPPGLTEPGNHSPEVTSIRAVRDDKAFTGVSLVCTWKDPDDDIVPGNTRIFLVPEYDINRFREINLTKELASGLVNQEGCNLRNIVDLTEGRFGVKVHIEDEEGNADGEVVSSEMEKVSEFTVELLKIDDKAGCALVFLPLYRIFMEKPNQSFQLL